MNDYQFIDRDEELNTLEREYNRSEAAMVIIYGRRRVGKTTLINEFLKHHENHYLYFLATQESEDLNRLAFRNQVAECTNNKLLQEADVDWLTLFQYLTDNVGTERIIIVLDEFQYLGKANAAFPSIIQKIWDTLLKERNVMLILCGSLITLMEQQTLVYASPLYGRRTAQIKLKPISFTYYSDFYPHKKEEELIPFYAVTGGVPKYIESFKECSHIISGIKQYILNPQSYLYEEPYFLLQNEVSEIGSYFSLMRAIALGHSKLTSIATYLGVKQTNLPKYLKTLMDLDLIEREVPVTEDNPEKSKSGLYHIKDCFMAFWFKFVYPYRSFLERNEQDYVIEQIEKMFVQNYVSFVYEDLCREKMWTIAANAKSIHFDRLGRYWGNICEEVDILGLDTLNHTMTMGECKYTISPKGLDILRTLEKKAKAIKEKLNYNCTHFIIFSTAGFTKELETLAQSQDNIILVDTLTPRK